MPKRFDKYDQSPGGYDPLADLAERFAVEPLRLRPGAEIGLESNTGGPGGPAASGMTQRALQQRLDALRARDFVPDDPSSVSKMDYGKGERMDPERWHGVGGGVKLTTPFSELTGTVVPPEGGVPPQRLLDPASLLGGVGLATLGDKTRNFGTLTNVQGIDLSTPQPLEGGYRFGDEFPGNAWASEKVPLTKLYERAQEVSDDGKKPVYGIPVAQGATGGDAARMMTGPLLDLMRQAELSPEAKTLLDQMMSAQLTNTKTGKTRWPGVDEVLKNPEWHDTASMNDRAALAKMMNKSAHANERVPVAALRRLITAPDLLNRPALTTGMSVNQFDLGQGLNFNPDKVHSSYPVQAPGTSLGRLGLMPYDWMFQTHAATRPPGEDLSSAQRTVMTQMPVQEFNNEWLDNLMRRIEGYQQ